MVLTPGWFLLLGALWRQATSLATGCQIDADVVIWGGTVCGVTAAAAVVLEEVPRQMQMPAGFGLDGVVGSSSSSTDVWKPSSPSLPVQAEVEQRAEETTAQPTTGSSSSSSSTGVVVVVPSPIIPEDSTADSSSTTTGGGFLGGRGARGRNTNRRRGGRGRRNGTM